MILADFFKKKPSSGNVAKDRLKLVLVSDRSNCSPDIMEQIKNDIISVLSKYVEIDLEGLDIKISQTDLDGDGSVPALFANIPIKDMKSEARNRAEKMKAQNTKNQELKPQTDDKNSAKDTVKETSSADKTSQNKEAKTDNSKASKNSKNSNKNAK